MNIEQKINYQLNKLPYIKKIIKRIYQVFFYILSDKKRVEGELVRLTPNDEFEYFFGYYDKSPWDFSNRYVLSLRVKKTWEDVSPKDIADIVVIDTAESYLSSKRVTKVAETRTWNVQQGCMLQWLGKENKIIFNDFRNDSYCSVILNLDTMEEKVINCPIYTVSSDGKIALSLDFSRLYSLRPGYGYYNLKETTSGEKLPESTAIWKINLENGEIKELLTYKDFAQFEPRMEMKEYGTVHKVNHLMLSPNSERFMVLYRFFNGKRKYTRLITCDIDGNNMYLLSDDDMVSHCSWKNNQEILAYENKEKTGPGYYLMKDKTEYFKQCWNTLTCDGHPSFSPTGELIVTDTYPDRSRKSSLILMINDSLLQKYTVVAKVFSPFKYDNDTRCDLHPRWNRDGSQICIDSVFEGKRALYSFKIDKGSLL